MKATSPTATRSFSRQDLIPLDANLLWKIEHGAVRTVTWSSNGEMISLGIWGPGDVVGRPLSRLDPYRIECLTPVKATMLPDPVWHQMLNPILWHAQQKEELVKIVHFPSTEERLLQFLEWLGQKFGHDGQQGRIIDLRLTHQEIAETLNTSRVTVTRLLNQFEQQGMIQRHRHCWILIGRLQ